MSEEEEDEYKEYRVKIDRKVKAKSKYQALKKVKNDVLLKPDRPDVEKVK